MSYFDTHVLEPSQSIPVLVDFWAPWCGPCRVLGPILDKLAQEMPTRFRLVKLNTEEHREIAEKFRIFSIPAVKLFEHGKVIAEFEGALPEARVRAWLDQTLPSPGKRALALAKEHLAAARPKEAVAELMKAIVDPSLTEARALLAAQQLFDDAAAARKSALTVAEGSVGYDLAAAVLTLVDLRESPPVMPDDLPDGQKRAWTALSEGVNALDKKDFAKAFDAWIASMKLSRKPGDDLARKSCIALFQWLGAEHPLTQEYRRQFASALY